MKKNIIIITLILIAISFTSLIGYQVVSANTEVNNNEDIINYQINREKYFSSYGYTIDNPNIINNPYNISPLTSLIIFETKEEEEITVTVKGKDANSTYTKTYPKTKEHYIEVYGLYPDYDNTIILNYKDTYKEINIKTEKLPQDLNPTKVENNTNNLTFITSDKYTYAIDNNNEVRWYLTENYSKKITRLPNGNFLLSSNKILTKDISIGLVEINLLGKIYNEYNIGTGYYGSYATTENTILVLSNNLLEIDKQTGNIINEYKLKEKYQTISFNNNIITLSNNKTALEINYLTKEYNYTTVPQTTNENNISLPLYTNNEYKLKEGLTFNTEEETKESSQNIILINYKKIDNNYKKYNIKIDKESDKLIISGNFNSSDKAYIILDKFLDKRVYNIDTNSNTSYKYIHNQTLKGKYSIYIKINDIIYKTDQYVKF